MRAPADPSAGALVVSPEDPRTPEVVALLEAHLDLMRSLSPPEEVHALDLEGLSRPQVAFFAARRAGALVAIGALQDLGPAAPGHGELKSMHVRGDVRGAGLGWVLLTRLLEEARARGLRRVSLETGTQPEFAAARRLYAAQGFVECGPFADYAESPWSTFMTRLL